MTPNATSGPASASANVASRADTFKFTTINNPADVTFNQLLGINDKFTISGYYGSGMTGHPNRGYTVVAPFPPGVFTAEDFPGSVQTQVTCIDNKGNTGGFWIGPKGVNRGFIEWNGVFTSYTHPTAKATVTQILGLNNDGIAAGFYTGKNGVNHGFTLDQATGTFTPIVPPGATNVTASAINNKGDVVGFYTTGSQVTLGFLYKKATKTYTVFRFPGSNNTTPFGVNDGNAIVGSYVDAKDAMHGFLLTDVLTTAKFTSIDDPNGVGTTTINGIAPSTLDMVGFFVDGDGNTDGMIIQPK
jgi:probable HAF family extracellular repeat protein